MTHAHALRAELRVSVLLMLVASSLWPSFAHAEVSLPVTVTPDLVTATPDLADVDPSDRPPLQTAGPEAPPPPPEPHLWDGNHTSIVAGPTLSFLDKAPPGLDGMGYGLRVAARVGTITQFVHAELGVEHTQFGGTGGAGLQRTEVGFQFGTHPGFPLVVFNDMTYDIFSGLHGYVGASLVRATLTGTDALAAAHVKNETEHSEWQPCIYVGAALDVPISPRNLAWGIWATAAYNLRWMWFGPKEPMLGLGDSQALLLLSFRWNSTSWARVPKPFGTVPK